MGRLLQRGNDGVQGPFHTLRLYNITGGRFGTSDSRPTLSVRAPR